MTPKHSQYVSPKDGFLDNVFLQIKYLYLSKFITHF